MSKQAAMERVQQEAQELFVKWKKLEDFFTNPLYVTLTSAEQNLLQMQSKVMGEYHNILRQRLAYYAEHRQKN